MLSVTDLHQAKLLRQPPHFFKIIITKAHCSLPPLCPKTAVMLYCEGPIRSTVVDNRSQLLDVIVISAGIGN